MQKLQRVRALSMTLHQELDFPESESFIFINWYVQEILFTRFSFHSMFNLANFVNTTAIALDAIIVVGSKTARTATLTKP